MNFHHKKCSSPVKLDMATIGRLVTDFGFSVKNGLQPTMGDIIPSGDAKPKVIFWCTTCHEEIGTSDLEAYCMFCGEKFGLKDLFAPSQSSGIYCSQCIAKYVSLGEKSTKLLSIIDKINVRNMER